MRKKEKITLEEFGRLTEEYSRYAKSNKKTNPNKPSEFEIRTSLQLEGMSHVLYDIKEQLIGIRSGININTIVMAVGFAGLGIVFVMS